MSRVIHNHDIFDPKLPKDHKYIYFFITLFDQNYFHMFATLTTMALMLDLKWFPKLLFLAVIAKCEYNAGLQQTITRSKEPTKFVTFSLYCKKYKHWPSHPNGHLSRNYPSQNVLIITHLLSPFLSIIAYIHIWETSQNSCIVTVTGQALNSAPKLLSQLKCQQLQISFCGKFNQVLGHIRTQDYSRKNYYF